MVSERVEPCAGVNLDMKLSGVTPASASKFPSTAACTMPFATNVPAVFAAKVAWFLVQPSNAVASLSYVIRTRA